MKTVKGFIIGFTVCLVVMWVFGCFSITAQATGELDDTSNTPDLVSLLPDIGKIYRSALGSPYRQVETEITDPEIAAFFKRFMDETGLDKAGLEP